MFFLTIQDMRGDSRPDPTGASSSEQGRGGRSLSRDRANGSSRKSNEYGGAEDEPPPAISSADLDQLMEDFDLNDPLIDEPAATSTAPASAAQPTTTTAAPTTTTESKLGGLAGGISNGLSSGLSSIPNPMGKLGELATKNPVTDGLSMGKSFLFKKFGL